MERHIDLQIQEDEQTPNRINPKKSMPKHTIKHQNTKEKTCKQPEKNNFLRKGKNTQNSSEFHLRKHEDLKEAAQYFSDAKTKELSIQAPMPSKNIL